MSGVLPALRAPRAWLAAAAVVVVAVDLTADGDRDPVAGVLAVVALGAWIAWTLVPDGLSRLVLLAAGAAAGALGAGLGHMVLIAPAVAACVVLLGTTRVAAPVGGAVCAAAAVVLTGTAVLAHLPGASCIGGLVALAFGALIGVTRRSRAVAAEREHALLVASVEAAAESARARLLEDRAAAARDVHDVLAHSLGGLVLQLDAVQALLEVDRVAEAAVRAAAARDLAAEGLAEARRAVAVLRDPSAAPAPVPDDALDRLVAAHRGLGGTASVDGDLSLGGVAAAERDALHRALQEALSNARRHAPGVPVRVRATRTDGRIELTVRTALPATAAGSPGGGHGLPGLRERFAALGDGAAATAGPDGGDFVVAARAALP